MIDDETLKQANPDLYRVAKEGGTERPFSSNLLEADADGIFRCAVCDASLFEGVTKFDSGTGWPSFTDPIPGAITRIDDMSHGMVRTEVRCATCGAHLGHVFPDGPKLPSGERQDRYCINGVCLLHDDTIEEGNTAA
jgi:peptide-methionine (R)-S-oxide reductase